MTKRPVGKSKRSQGGRSKGKGKRIEKMQSPRERSLSDSMDYDDEELAELHDRRERELLNGGIQVHGKYQLHYGAGGVGGGGGGSSYPKYDPFDHPRDPLPSSGGGGERIQMQYSDEDTEDASEDGDANFRYFFNNNGGSGERGGGLIDITDDSGETQNRQEIKEQVYFDKLNLLKAQLEELEAGNHTEYIRRVDRLQEECKERLEINQAWRDLEINSIEKDYSIEQKTIGKEFEEKKIELRERLVNELEDQKKQIESERYATELTSDPSEVKPIVTRKLRRRPNDPVPLPERRKKAPQSQITFLLDEKQIEEDIKAMQNPQNWLVPPKEGKGRKDSYGRKVSAIEMDYSSEASHSDSRIEDGKLFYEKRWFHRGQPVYIEGQGMTKTGGVICSISQDLVWVRKVHDQTKVRVPISLLQKGKMYIKRRAN